MELADVTGKRVKKMKSRPSLSVAQVGGLLGTPAMTVVMYMLAPVLGLRTDIVAMLAEVLGGWKMGLLVHILDGAVIFPAVFVFLFYRLLPGAAIVRGVAFGLVLWLTSQALVMPMMGAGFFSAHIGGLRATMASLLGHVVYGGLLGLVCMVQFMAQDDASGRSIPVGTLTPGAEPKAR
jgi:uncharacterized membrane protein YagU involved in acid resistance